MNGVLLQLFCFGIDIDTRNTENKLQSLNGCFSTAIDRVWRRRKVFVPLRGLSPGYVRSLLPLPQYNPLGIE